jgi:hypothetical protein
MTDNAIHAHGPLFRNIEFWIHILIHSDYRCTFGKQDRHYFSCLSFICFHFNSCSGCFLLHPSAI